MVEFTHWVVFHHTGHGLDEENVEGIDKRQHSLVPRAEQKAQTTFCGRYTLLDLSTINPHFNLPVRVWAHSVTASIRKDFHSSSAIAILHCAALLYLLWLPIAREAPEQRD